MGGTRGDDQVVHVDRNGEASSGEGGDNLRPTPFSFERISRYYLARSNLTKRVSWSGGGLAAISPGFPENCGT